MEKSWSLVVLYHFFTTGIKLKALSEKKKSPKYYFYGVVNCFMEQAHKSHRPQNVITKCTWHQLQEVLIWLTHVLSRRYKLWEIEDACISPFWMANHTTHYWFIMGMVLSMLYTTLHVASSVIQGNVCMCVCLILSAHSSKGHTQPLRNLCFCLIEPVFPVTLWFSKCILGIHGSLRSNQGIPEVKNMFLIHEDAIWLLSSPSLMSVQ